MITKLAPKGDFPTLKKYQFKSVKICEMSVKTTTPLPLSIVRHLIFLLVLYEVSGSF